MTDDNEKSVPQAMEQLAKQFEEKGHKLGKFSERYRVYRQKQQELESDPEAPQGFSGFLGKTLANDDISNANQLYEPAFSLNASPKNIREAIRDLDNFLTLFPNYTQAEKMRDLLQTALR